MTEEGKITIKLALIIVIILYLLHVLATVHVN